MNNLLNKTALSAAIALTIAACSSSGGGGVAGIGGSGFISSGSITGFGSVFVNGVEFETDSAIFDVDGDSGTQDDLAIGMVVKVSGTINDDGITGTATGISFDDELQGPVATIENIGNDGVKRSLEILGVTVIIDSSSTTFDISGKDDVPPSTVFDFDTIAPANNVEVSGFFDSNGDIQATRIELKNLNFDANSIVEVKGTISNVNGTTFNLGTLTVNASSAEFDDLPNGLENGQLVEVKGTLDAGFTTITATKVEAEDNSIDDSDEFEIEGLVTDYVNNSNFKINGITVDASNATFEPASLTLENDLRIEAEGAIVNGILIADEIELEGGSIEVNANVTSINVSAGTFEVTPVSGQPAITVTITTGTQLEDDVNEIEPFTLNSLVVTDFVEVQGFDNGNGGITANQVEIKEPGDIKLQGVIQSGATAGTIKVFGIEFTIEDPGQTDFENANDMPINQTDFFNAVTLDTTLIKIQDDEVADGIANEIEIE